MLKTLLRALLVGSLVLASITACAGKKAPAVVISEARTQIQNGKSGEARIALKNLVDAHPEMSEAHALLAQIELDSGSARNANVELAKIPAGAFNDAQSQTVRIRTLLALGKYAEALSVLDTHTDRLIGVSQRAVLRAQVLLGLERPAEALQGLRVALDADPKNPQLIVGVATTLATLGNIGLAIRELDAAASAGLAPDAEILRARGDLYLRAGKVTNALADFRAAIKAAPASWPFTSRYSAELSIGDAELSAGHIDAAKTQLATLKQLAPKTVALSLLAGRVAMVEGKYGEAVDTLQAVSDVLPDNTAIQYVLIEALLRSGNVVRATAELEKRIQAAPNDLRARELLAKVSLQQNRPNRVIELLADATGDESKSNAAIGGLLATAHEAQDRATKAIAELSEQLGKAPHDANVRTQLAAAYLLSGDANRALRVLHEAAPALTSAPAVGVEFAARLAQGNDREINPLVKLLLDSDSIAPDALLACSDAAQRAGRGDLARSLIARAMQRDPKNAGALFRLASVEFAAQHYAAAKTALDTYLAANPNDLNARIALARVLEMQGDVAGARGSLQAAIKFAPSTPQPYLLLAALELRAGKPAAASPVLDNLIGVLPKDGRAANTAGMLLLEGKRFDEARTRFRQAVDQKSDVADYWFNLGRAQLALSDKEAARESFANSVARRPEWLEANIAAVRLNGELGHAAEARSLAEALAAKAPKNAAVWLVLGDVALLGKRLDDAAKAYAQSYALQPTSLVAVREFEVGVARGAQNAEQPLQNWLAREPDDLMARRRLADYYLQKGDAKAATTQLTAILKVAPNDLSALNNLAWLLIQSEPKRAEELARRAIAIDPQNAAVADTLGSALIEQKRYAEARKMLEGAAKGLPKDLAVQYRYALSLARAGERDAARQVLTKLLAGNEKFADADNAKKLAQELDQ